MRGRTEHTWSPPAATEVAVRSIDAVEGSEAGHAEHTAGPPRRGLLVVHHSRTGRTQLLCDAAIESARQAVGEALPVVALDALEAGPQDVLGAGGILMCTPARFGYMSGALKDFLERIYHPCLEQTRGLAYGLVVKGDTDVDGAVSSVERIVAGLAWRRVLPVVTVVGDIEPAHLDAAAELGGGLAAGIEAGMF